MDTYTPIDKLSTECTKEDLEKLLIIAKIENIRANTYKIENS